jgi:hypothetical protein
MHVALVLNFPGTTRTLLFSITPWLSFGAKFVLCQTRRTKLFGSKWDGEDITKMLDDKVQGAGHVSDPKLHSA